MSRAKSDIISRALEIAYPSQAERDAALRRFAAIPPHHRDTVRTLLREAFDAVDQGRDLPDIPGWLAEQFAERREGKPERKTDKEGAERWKKALAETPRPKPKPPRSSRPLPGFIVNERGGAHTARACASCGRHPRAEDGLQRVGGRLLCPDCAAARFRKVNKARPDEPNVFMQNL